MSKEISVPLCLLFDLYAPLLSEKKRKAFEYYYFDDLSLSEISELQGVSRQAVLESIRSAEKKLTDLERKLGFRKRLSSISELAREFKGDAADEILSLCGLE